MKSVFFICLVLAAFGCATQDKGSAPVAETATALPVAETAAPEAAPVATAEPVPAASVAASASAAAPVSSAAK